MNNCLWLADLSLNDTALVGGKASSLGEMINGLKKIGINVPDGFVLSTKMYHSFIEHNDLREKIMNYLDKIDYQDLISLKREGLNIRNCILNSEFPQDLQQEIFQQYHNLSEKYSNVDGTKQKNTDVAVRSSSTAEDSQDSSFAGQYDTFLNVRGEKQLLEAIKGCYASLYNNRAISYRHDIKWEDPDQLGIAVVIQKMVRSDCGKSGVMFTIDTESGFDKTIVINASYGLCELIVQGSSIKPDEYILYKPTLRDRHPAIIDKRMGNKTKKMVYSDNPAEKVRVISVGKESQHAFCLDDENILELGKWALAVEDYYSQFYGENQCYDIEFAYDGLERKMYLVQVRPETIHSNKDKSKFVEYHLDSKSNKKNIICSGISVGKTINHGKVRVIMSLDDRGDNEEIVFEDGDVLVTSSTDPDWEPLMKRAGAIITDHGGRTSHASIVSRELGVTCVVGCGNATNVLQNGETVTVNCADGDVGYVYKGHVSYHSDEIDLTKLKESPVSLMMNLASPDIAFRYANYPHNGVGLAREEFIINNFIKCHPNFLLDYDKKLLGDTTTRKVDPANVKELEELIVGYSSGQEYYVNKLKYGISRIAAAVAPHPVIVRFSDFKSNEYYNLLGGQYYEPKEENPMIGWRGCSRYYSENFEEAFGLECKAIKEVRDVIGLTNVKVMLPFCRTLNECVKVQETMKKYGLTRGENGLEIYLMCEIPSNVILAEEFCKLVDGFSIGSNDLTQLTLGVDRDSGILANMFEENNEAVRKMIKMAIETCKKNNTKIGICGQGPSDNLEFAKFLMNEGIDTISLTPDSIIPTIKAFSNL